MILLGTVSPDKKFHTIARALCSNETHREIAEFIRAVKAEVDVVMLAHVGKYI